MTSPRSKRPQKARGRSPRAPVAPRFEPDELFAPLQMNAWSLRHMSRVYRDFEGDFVAALVLGEVTHHNLSTLAAAMDYSRPRVLAHLATPEGWRDPLPCNAYSISEALQIPRETVRRKVAWLIRRGLLERRGRNDLYLATDPNAYARFWPSTVSGLEDLLATAERIHARLSTVAPR